MSSYENAGFIVVDAHQSTYGKILFMNKTLKKYLKRDNEDIRFLHINQTMPKLIEENHDQFMDDYNVTGETKLMNRKILHFVKDKTTAIIPVEVILKFHYSNTYNYCFYGLISHVHELIPFKDGLKYSTDQLIFMTISMEDGQIYEVSENFLQILSLKGIINMKDVR